jgi:acetolactate synthase-1/2/3 large subunit
VEVCFSNPGTSEMHFVAALDRIPGMRCVLGCRRTWSPARRTATGAWPGKPAVTLLHCGPGLANGCQPAQRAPGALGHRQLRGRPGDLPPPHDAPLTADTEGFARGVSAWVRTSQRATEVGRDAAVAVQAARTSPGQIATMILPVRHLLGRGRRGGRGAARARHRPGGDRSPSATPPRPARESRT